MPTVRDQNPNIEFLEIAVDALGTLTDELVFLGGCATALLLTDPAAPPVRVTRDVDVITEVTSLVEYHRLCEQLRERGFQEDPTDGAPVCRWTGHGILLDVMPTDPTVLGFANEWYDPAIKTAKDHVLANGRTIRLVAAPYFLATKLVAFNDRGNQDYVASHDLEDITSILDGRPQLVAEVQDSEEELKHYLAGRFAALLEDSQFREALPGHLPGDTASQARLPKLVSRIEVIAGRC